jgi:hypothetical protein
VVRIFIGFDSGQTVAYHVLAHSLLARSSLPLAITPIALRHLGGVFERERHPLQSTEFSFSRFLAPHLCGYEGWSLYLDCDMLVRRDIAELWALRDSRFAVQVVQHDYETRAQRKLLDQPQSSYPKKNWSSLMLFNNERCRALTPEFVNTASGLELHQFAWLDSAQEIGALPDTWNHLVGEKPPRPDAALVHFTLGLPYLDDYKSCEFSDEWKAEREAMLAFATK